MSGEDDVSPQQAKDDALRERAEAQAKWKVIMPLVESLRQIRSENHLGERIANALRGY